MATNNFHNVNASNIFSCLIPSDISFTNDSGNIVTETHYPTQLDFDDLIKNLETDISSLKNSTNIEYNANFLRSYPGQVLGNVSIDKTFLGQDVRITIIPVIRSGYYEGANLDWELEFCAGCNEVYNKEDLINEWIEEVEFKEEYNKGLIAIHEGYLWSWIENNLRDLIQSIENIFSDYSDELKKVAQFSNGEAIYQKA